MNKVLLAGRNSNCDFVLQDQYASKQHLQILISEDKDIYIVDLNSTSGTTINGHLIKPSVPVKLNSYDIVRAADTLVPWKKFLNEEETIKLNPDTDYNEYKNTISKRLEETISKNSDNSLKKKSSLGKHIRSLFR